MKITGGRISEKEARKGSKKYQDRFSKEIKDGQMALSGLINIECFKRIAKVEGCEAVRWYPIINDEGIMSVVFAPADKEGNPIVSSIQGKDPGDSTIENISSTCPPFCNEDDPITG